MAEPIRIYLDEDVSVIVGDMLRARGFDVLSTRDAGNLGSNDREQLMFASAAERVFLTHNRVDFERLAVHYYEEKISHSGIVIAVRRQPSEITLKLLNSTKGLRASDMLNQMRYI